MSEPPNSIYDILASIRGEQVLIAILAVVGLPILIISAGVLLRTVFGVECIGICGN